MPLYPAHWEADVVLRDGRTAHLRPVTPGDAARIIDFYAGVSDESKYFRFFAPYPYLSARDVDGLTTVDYNDNVVLLALYAGKVIGIVQYARTSRTEAEVAFLVQDEHHGRGLASVLLEHLAEAADERGIRRFTADVLPANRQMLAVFRAAGYSVDSHTEDGVVSLSFDIAPTEASRAVTQEREHRAESRSVAWLLKPKSVAVAGARRSGLGVGSAALRHLIEGGFTGDLHVVHPVAWELAGVPAYKRLRDIPGGVELVVVAVPAHLVGDVVLDAAAAGARGLVVVSEGFADTGEPAGRALQRELVLLARRYGMRLLGPNALGLVNTDPAVRLNASLAPVLPPHGTTAFFAQSGALGTALLENIAERGLGISTFVSAGNRADISGNDMLQYWEDDPGTSAVMLYLESLGNPRKFSRLARRVGQVKPVVAVRSAGATQGVPLGHTVRPTHVPPAAIEAMYAQAGVIGVDTIHEMFDVAQLLATQPVPLGRGVAIIGNSDALGLLAAAACERNGLVVAGSRVNLSSAASAADVTAAMLTAEKEPDVDSIVVALARPMDRVPDKDLAVEDAAARGSKTVVATYVGFDPQGRPSTERPRRVPAYPTPEDAVRALAAVTAYGAWRSRPDLGEPLPGDVDIDAAVTLVEEALVGRPEGVELDRASVGALLRCYGVELSEPGPTDGLGRAVVVRSTEDTLFGPIMSFGLAGIASDVLGDVGYRIPPLSAVDARSLVLSIKAAPLLVGVDGLLPLDVAALVTLIRRVSRLSYEVPDIALLELTVVVLPAGVAVTAARCRLELSAVRVDRSARSLPMDELLLAAADDLG